jgi:hypothetical protein
MGYCELGEEKERYKPAFFLDGLQIESGVLFLFPISFVMEPFVFFFLFLSLRSVLTEGYQVLLAMRNYVSVMFFTPSRRRRASLPRPT